MKYILGLVLGLCLVGFAGVAEAGNCHNGHCVQQVRVQRVQRVVQFQRVVVPQAIVVSEFIEVPNLQVVVNQHGNVFVEQVIVRQNFVNRHNVQNVQFIKVNQRQRLFRR